MLDLLRVQHLWHHCFSELGVVVDQHPVLLTEAALNPRSHRGKASEVLFETFAVPALYIETQAILALYASGRTTGLVLDSGDGVTAAVPVVEGFVIPHAISRMDIAGRDITGYLQRLLRRAGHHFSTTAEMEIVRDIKEKICYVAYNIDAHNKDEADDVEVSRAASQQQQTAATASSSSPQPPSLLCSCQPEVPYKLPDGSVLNVSSEKYRAPELLFSPQLLGSEEAGIQHQLTAAIARCDLDVRRALFSSIILSGGSTLFDGFGDRLLSECRRLSPRDTKIRIYAPPERILSTWIGGSILASLASFKRMWITRKEWEEQGRSAVYRKTL